MTSRKIEIRFVGSADPAAVEMLRDELERWVTARALLYGAEPPIIVEESESEHLYRQDVGENLLALDRRSHDRLHRGEDPHPKGSS